MSLGLHPVGMLTTNEPSTVYQILEKDIGFQGQKEGTFYFSEFIIIARELFFYTGSLRLIFKRQCLGGQVTATHSVYGSIAQTNHIEETVRKISNALSQKIQEIYGELGLNDVKTISPLLCWLQSELRHMQDYSKVLRTNPTCGPRV